MTMSVEQLWSLPEPALVGAYAEARRRYAEKKFERDTQRARLRARGRAARRGMRHRAGFTYPQRTPP